MDEVREEVHEAVFCCTIYASTARAEEVERVRLSAVLVKSGELGVR